MFPLAEFNIELVIVIRPGILIYLIIPRKYPDLILRRFYVQDSRLRGHDGKQSKKLRM